MGIYADRMASLKVHVTSPDHNIEATLRKKNNLDISFLNQSYRHYREGSLEHQLSQVARLLVVGQRRAHFQALSEAQGIAIKSDDRRFGRPIQEYIDKMQHVDAKGRSSDDVVRIYTTGLVEWHVKIKPNTLALYSEEQFIRQVGMATKKTMDNYRQGVSELRKQELGTELKEVPA